MNAKTLAILATSPEAQQRRQAVIEAQLGEILKACQRAASEGQLRQFFKFPKEYLSEYMSVLGAMDFDVSKEYEEHAVVAVVVSWAQAAKAPVDQPDAP